MNAVSDTWYLFVRHIKDSLRTPIWLLINLIQPLVWLLLFSKVLPLIPLYDIKEGDILKTEIKIGRATVPAVFRED